MKRLALCSALLSLALPLLAGPAQGHVDLAQRLLRKGRLKDARREAEVARQLAPQDPEVLALWQRLEGTEPVAVAAGPTPTPSVFLGIRLEGPLTRARLAYRESRLSEAKRLWDEVLLLDAHQAEALDGLERLKREAYHPDADQPFDKAVKDLFEAAWRDLRKGRSVEARKKLKEAQSLNPEQEDLRTALAWAAKPAQDQQDRREAQSLLAQGQSLLSEGEDAKAAAALSAALAVDPGLAPAQAALGTIKARNADKVKGLLEEGAKALQGQRYQAAATAFEKALVLDPGHSAAAQGLAQARATLGGQRDRAAQRAESDRLYNAGVEAWQAGRLAEAASQFRACLAVDASDPEAAKALAVLTKKLDERADKDRQDAGQLLDEGRTLEARGAWEEALRRYERAAAKDPGLAEAGEARERLKGRMKGI